MLIERSHIKQKMGLRERLGSMKAAFTGLPNQSILRMAQAFMPTYGEPPRRSTADWIELYNKSPRMNPVHQIASDVATSFYGLYKTGDAKKTKLTNNPVQALLKKPSPNLTITEYVLFYITQVYLLLPAGEAFWIKERSGLGKVTELWPVPPSWVLEIPSSVKNYYTIYPQGNMQCSPIYVPSMDMIYFKKTDVSNPYLRGVGRANALGDEIETDEFMAKYQKRYFYNDAIPPMVGMMPGADKPTINRTEEMWQQKYGGAHNKHKVAWLNWDAKFELLKETNKDMDFIESRKYLRDVSNQHFSIPPELFGILENSNRSTIDAAYYLYTKNVLRKELKFIDDVLNLQLVPEFADDVYLEHDNVVPEDEEFNLKKASEGLKNGGILVDEWRLANGWPELPDGKGQILYTPLNMVPTSMDGKTPLPTNLPAREPPGDEPKMTKSKIPEAHKEQMWNVFDKAAVKNERPFINALKKYFQQQQDKINQALEKGVKAATDNPDELLDWEAEDALLLGVLTPLWTQSLTEGFTTVNVLFEFGLTEELVQPAFQEWIRDYGADRVNGINDTTKQALRDALSEGIADGEGIPKLRDRVSVVMTDAKGYRATLIARTETMTTVNYGTLKTYQSANVQQKEWLSQIDNRTRQAHVALNGEVVGIDQPFSNGLQYPQEPNCRCTILPVLPELML